MIKTGKTLVSVKNLTVHFGHKTALNQINWAIQDKTNQVLIGPNGSGKSLLAAFLSQQLDVVHNQPHFLPGFNPQNDLAFVSFEYQKKLFAIDDYNDDSDFLDYQDIGTTAEEIILDKTGETSSLEQISNLLKIGYLLKRGIRFLSTGEMRKVLIARAMLKKPKLLIIDSPFEGLDTKSRLFMRQRLSSLIQEQQCLLIINEDDQIIQDFDHITCLNQGKIIASGPASEIINSEQWQKLFKPHQQTLSMPSPHHRFLPNTDPAASNLITMKDVSVKYGEVIALNQLTWTVNQGENWLISGPNGAGKSTLLSLITADNPQAYGQELYLFGRKRGSGETIWDIKKKIGIVTNALQLQYKVPLKALEVVLSGFFDSIGLYDQPDAEMVHIAKEWLNLLEIENIHQAYFTDLSYGEQRMLLLARAMVKQPALLILDEPCQGLDKTNRIAVLNLIDYIAQQSVTSILYVSHSHAEDLQCITNKLNFTYHKKNGFSTSTEAISKN